MSTAKINDIDVHYEASGAGPAVVFLHGLMGSIARARKMGEGIEGLDRKSTRLNSSHIQKSRMPSSA